jgi:hypothetical protein
MARTRPSDLVVRPGVSLTLPIVGKVLVVVWRFLAVVAFVCSSGSWLRRGAGSEASACFPNALIIAILARVSLVKRLLLRLLLIIRLRSR